MAGAARRPLRACAIAMLLAGVAPALSARAARADGDPASDVLLVQNVFYPYQPKVSARMEAAMNSALRDASEAGLALKVAIIGSAPELGLVPYLFGHPQAYADFLDREISFNHPQPLLVVMPTGFGLANAGTAAGLRGTQVDSKHASYGLTRSAILAAVALARARGVAVSAPAIPPDSSASSQPPALLVFGLPVALLALAGALVLRAGARRGRRPR